MIVLAMFAVVTLFVGWYFGRRYSQVEFACQNACAALSHHEKRLQPLEDDLQQRQKCKARLKGAFDWLRGKIGF